MYSQIKWLCHGNLNEKCTLFSGYKVRYINLNFYNFIYKCSCYIIESTFINISLHYKLHSWSLQRAFFVCLFVCLMLSFFGFNYFWYSFCLNLPNVTVLIFTFNLSESLLELSLVIQSNPVLLNKFDILIFIDIISVFIQQSSSIWKCVLTDRKSVV